MYHTNIQQATPRHKFVSHYFPLPRCSSRASVSILMRDWRIRIRSSRVLQLLCSALSSFRPRVLKLPLTLLVPPPAGISREERMVDRQDVPTPLFPTLACYHHPVIVNHITLREHCTAKSLAHQRTWVRHATWQDPKLVWALFPFPVDSRNISPEN